MKNLSLIINAVLAILIGILFYNQYKCKKSCHATVPRVTSDSTAVQDVTTPSKTNVAYINSDTLFKKYKFAVKLDASMKEKQKNAENNIQAKGKKLQADMNLFQEKIRKLTITEAEAQAEQQRLATAQENLMKEQEALSGQLMDYNSEANKQIADTVRNFLIEYNRQKGYDYILNYSDALPVLLYKNAANDVTDEVVEMLNARYEEKK